MCLGAVSEWILGVSGSHMMFGRVPVGENGNEESLGCRLRGGASNVAGLAGAGVIGFFTLKLRFLRVHPCGGGATILPRLCWFSRFGFLSSSGSAFLV